MHRHTHTHTGTHTDTHTHTRRHTHTHCLICCMYLGKEAGARRKRGDQEGPVIEVEPIEVSSSSTPAAAAPVKVEEERRKVRAVCSGVESGFACVWM